MSQPADLIQKIQELEEKVRILQMENDQLAERAEDTLLLGLIAEQISGAEEIGQVLESGLERISVLKDIPFCACCSLTGNKAIIFKSYLSFTGEDMSNRTIDLPETMMRQLNAGHYLLSKNECRQTGISFEEKAGSFVPLSAIGIPFKSRFSEANLFFFGDDKSADRLPRVADMLHRVTEMIVARMDNISLFCALQDQNRDLDRTVEERTRDLQESEERFRRLAENARDVIYRMSLPDGRYEYVSPASTELFGYAPEEFYGTPQLIRNVIHPDWHEYFEKQWSRLLRGDMPPTYEFSIIHKSGQIRWVNQRNILIRDDGGRIIAIEGIVTNITDRKRAEAELARVNRALRMLSDANQTLIRVTDETTLLNEVCRLIVGVGGYRLAWIAFAEQDEARTLRPMAQAGFESGYIETAKLTWADTERGRGPGGTAVRTGKPCLARNIQTDPSFAPWREEVLRRGYQAVLALPLSSEGRAFGVLGIYAGEAEAFDDQEVEILNELAGDLAFGIAMLRAQAEHRRAAEQLEAQYALLTAIMNSSNEIIIFSLDENYRYTAFNEKHRKEMKRVWDADIEIGMNLLDCMRIPELRELAKQSIDRALKGEVFIEVQHQPVPDIFYELSWNPVIQSGTIVGATVFIHDITERKNAENKIKSLNEELEQRVLQRTAELEKKSDELRDSQMALVNIVEDLNEKSAELEQFNIKLQELDRLKSMFIASMSHELRTPLNSIIGFSSILSEEWLGPLNEEQRKNLGTVLRAGRHLLALINDVIDVSKVEAGKMETSHEAFDLYDVMVETAAFFIKEAHDKGLELIIEPLHQKMWTDRRRLCQCLINLISNAVKFTERGSVKMMARILLSGGAGRSRTMVELLVEDTGIGIREEDLGQLFGAFVRLKTPATMSVKGTGLGLYLTRKITNELLRGDVEVRSRFGKGSRFSLRIPVQGEEEGHEKSARR